MSRPAKFRELTEFELSNIHGYTAGTDIAISVSGKTKGGKVEAKVALDLSAAVNAVVNLQKAIRTKRDTVVSLAQRAGVT